MDRYIVHSLLKWKQKAKRMPLLVRGARQIGKSYVIEQFAKKYFPHSVTINFELEPKFAECFNSLDPVAILNEINLLTSETIVPGQTLLFIDEIQECPKAVLALRYFKEKMPNLAVIAAGSLLEFILHDEDFRMPVGRVQYLYLKPMSFREFLTAAGHNNLNEYLSEVTFKTEISSAVHAKLLKLVREYMILGGMPEVIQTYLDTQSFNECQNIQASILKTYSDDFGKYATTANQKYLRKLYDKAPGLIGQQFKYSKVDSEMRSRDIKHAFELLSYAGIIYPIYATSASGLPLNALINEKKFRLAFLDVGLVKRASRLSAELLLEENLLLINQGSIAEQFVGQELLAYSNPYDGGELHFWHREKASSTAEVDYVINVDQDIIPIEVKAGSTGQLKSFKRFMEEKKSRFGIHISQRELSYKEGVVSLPLYLIAEIPRLIQLCH